VIHVGADAFVRPVSEAIAPDILILNIPPLHPQITRYQRPPNTPLSPATRYLRNPSLANSLGYTH
jgi:hypothetical protein